MAAPTSRRLVTRALVGMIDDGASMQHISQILAAYLVENQLTRDQDLFVRDLRREILGRFGLASVEVKSAHKLSTNVSGQIKTYIKRQTGADEVEIMDSVDSSLIAGLIISTTDSELDESLKSKIRELRMV